MKQDTKDIKQKQPTSTAAEITQLGRAVDLHSVICSLLCVHGLHGVHGPEIDKIKLAMRALTWDTWGPIAQPPRRPCHRTDHPCHQTGRGPWLLSVPPTHPPTHQALGRPTQPLSQNHCTFERMQLIPVYS
jgi:hypothetical protein